MVDLMCPQYPAVWSNTSPDVTVKVFFRCDLTWKSPDFEKSRQHPHKWAASSNQLKAGREKTEVPQRRGNSASRLKL